MRPHLWLAAGLAACVSPSDPESHRPGIQVGHEGSFGCTITEITEVTDGSALLGDWGISADDALAPMIASFSGTGELLEGGTVDPVALQLSAAGTPQWIVSDDAATCPPYLALDVDLSLDAGAVVAAELEGVLGVQASGQGFVWAGVDHTLATGTLEPRWLDPATMAWTELQVLVSTDGKGISGAVGFTGCTADDVCAPPVDASGKGAELAVTLAPVTP